MILPRKLKEGDTVMIVATARKISLQTLQPSIKILESWGLHIILGKNLFLEFNQFAGNDEQRIEDLQFAIDSDSISAILCARGGYGTVKIIDEIDFSNLKKNPKWIIGYSDITVLHSHLNNLGIMSLHATMPINFPDNTQSSLESLKQVLFNSRVNIKFRSANSNRLGKVNAEIVGGNLSVLYSLLGSRSDISTEKKILFIEDLDEYLYHIDRMMVNMKRNNKLSNLAALIVGSMKQMNDNEISFGSNAQEIILNQVLDYNYPVCFDFPSGHINDNRSFILGIETILEIGPAEVVFRQK